MIEVIQEFLKPKRVMGCDIGTTSFKFVALKRDKELLSLEALGIIDADILGGNTAALQRVHAFLKEYNISGSSCGINIEDTTLRIRRMDLPEMPENDLRVAIKWNFREYVDGPIEKYSIAYSNFGSTKVASDKKPILAYAVSNESVGKLVAMSKQIGLKASAIEPNASAMLAAFDKNIGFDSDKFYAMIDFGGHIANFIVVGNGVLLFSRPLPNAGTEELVKMVVREKSVTKEEAIKLVKEGAADGESVSTFLSQMVVEIQRSIDGFCLMFHVDRVESIYLSGGGSLIPGISDYLAKNLGIQTILFNPFARIDTSTVKGEIKNPGLYAVAVGLALPRGK